MCKKQRRKRLLPYRLGGKMYEKESSDWFFAEDREHSYVELRIIKTTVTEKTAKKENGSNIWKSTKSWNHIRCSLKAIGI